MHIFIRDSLVSDRCDVLSKGKVKDKAKADSKAQTNQTGETRGGNYVARLQIGYEKDGSPRYKYFQSLEERDKYLEGRGKAESKRNAKKLKKKTEDERKEHSEKDKATQGRQERGKLYLKDKKAKDEEVSKGFPHFVWSL